MAYHNLLKIDPFTRINDRWINSDRIDASPATESINHPMIPPLQRNFETKKILDVYRLIACDIVVETVFDYPYAYITEKLIRPILYKRMFIVVGAPGTLALLRSKGFQTFDDFIDENYDCMTDPTQRFFAVTDQIHRFCRRSMKDILQYLEDNKSKFDSNFETLKSLQHQELDELRKKLA